MVYRDIACWRFSTLMVLAVLLGPIPAWPDPAVFSTGSGFEADKCASLWLIKRFIEPTATFRFYPSGARIDQGTAFDTPDAVFHRTHNQSTFERLLDHHALRDPILLDLGRVIHDIEINTWARKVLPETAAILQDLEPVFASEEEPQALGAFCLNYFDRFYAQRRSSIPALGTPNSPHDAK